MKISEDIEDKKESIIDKIIVQDLKTGLPDNLAHDIADRIYSILQSP